MSKRISFIFKIAGMQVVILVLVTITGLFAYDKFSGVIEGIRAKLTPSSRLIKAGELLNHLNEAEINAKSYSLTRDTLYLDQFYFAAQNVETDLAELQAIEEKDSLDSETTEILGLIINQKFTVLRDLISLQDKFRVDQSLDRVNKKIADELDSSLSQTNAGMVEPEAKKRLGWLFKKNDVAIIKPDSLIQQSFNSITEEIDEVRSGERRIENEIKEKELQLIFADEMLNNEIAKRLEDIREEELAQVANETELAEQTIHDTKIQIAWFCFFIVVLLVFMAVVIIKYVRANAKYREALRLAKRNAEDLAKAKQNFLANISHEIRTPINAIAGFTEQLSLSGLSKEQRDQVQIIHKSTEHLTYLLNDLLDFSKLEADKITFENIAFDPSQLVADVLEVVSSQAAKKNLTLHTDLDPQMPDILIGDPYRLKQILLNLYSNSIKFTERGSVDLETKVVLQSEKEIWLLIIVRDTGIGMTTEQVSKIFAEFEQANESITRKFGGTGLGLSIVRMLINKLGGKIAIHSSEGVGTTTTLEIPYRLSQSTSKPATEIKKASAEEIRLNLSNLRILIVDDEEYNRKLLAAILKKHNAIYTEAADGMDAIHELDRNDYDIILMDARMPNMNGVETTKKIRAMRDPKKASIPILGISASTSDTDRQSYLDAGMNTSIPKPFKETLLLREIHRIMDRQVPVVPVHENGKDHHRVKSNIRFKDLQEMCDGDKNFYVDMLRTFIEGTQEGIQKIREAYARGDYESVGGQAHKIAAPCNHIGAIHLYGLLKKMEEVVREKHDLHQLADLVVKVHDEAIGVLEITQKELDSVTD